MTARLRTATVAVATGTAVFAWHAPAHAASEVDVGGYLEQALDEAHRDLLRNSVESGSRVTLGGVSINVEAGEASAVTAFTPRFAGLGTGGFRRHEPQTVPEAVSLDGAEPEPRRHGLRIGPQAGAAIGGVEVNWAAIAEMEEGIDASIDRSSAFAVGGQMEISNWHLDATYGQEPGLLGVDGERYTAGLGYDFGLLNTRVAYSMVENREQPAETTSMFTLGSELSLGPGLVVEGDLAYADERGDPNTAGRVSLRFNF